MSSSSGPNGVANGLVFCMDAGTIKNQTVFSSNFYTNSAFGDGSGMPYESGSNPTNEVIAFPNPGDSAFVLRQTGTFAYTEYQINLTSQLVASTTYCLSGWYAESSDYSCADGSRMFHCRANSSSGAHVALGIGIGTVLKTVVVNGITWKYCYDLITTPSDYNNDFNWYVGYGGSAYTGYRYYTNLKMERGTFPSMLDLSGRNNHLILTNGLSYNSNNSGALVLDGTNDFGYITNGMNFLIGNSCTFSAWVYRTSAPNYWAGIISNKVNVENGICLLINPSSRIFWQYDGGVSGVYAIDGGQTLSTNVWHHITGVYDNVGLKTYFNGVLNASANDAGKSITSSGNMDIAIGAQNTSGDSAFPGRLSDVRIYNRALTASEIYQNYISSRSRYGL
jgi:hypothetical protein